MVILRDGKTFEKLAEITIEELEEYELEELVEMNIVAEVV